MGRYGDQEAYFLIGHIKLRHKDFQEASGYIGMRDVISL